MKDLIQSLLKLLDDARTAATVEAEQLFDSTQRTEAQLDALGSQHQLEKRSGTKLEQAEGYQNQFVWKKLQECRQKFAVTKNRQQQFRKYLPMFRVLFASYRRLQYSLLNDYRPKNKSKERY
jgi:hypothetical protein